jgi:hypothetical protein
MKLNSLWVMVAALCIIAVAAGLTSASQELPPPGRPTDDRSSADLVSELMAMPTEGQVNWRNFRHRDFGKVINLNDGMRLYCLTFPASVILVKVWFHRPMYQEQKPMPEALAPGSVDPGPLLRSDTESRKKCNRCSARHGLSWAVP